jgi:hypothetical protein
MTVFFIVLDSLAGMSEDRGLATVGQEGNA